MSFGRKLIRSARKKMGRQARALRWPPVFIFQMGKVGSETLFFALRRQYKGRVVYAHAFSALTRGEKRLLARRKRFRLPILVICPVREPFSRNISSFFQNFTRNTGFSWKDRQWTTEALLRLFLEKHEPDFCTTWFETRFKPVFDLDILGLPFPVKQRWCIYSKGRIRVLLYRTDLSAAEQTGVISDFSGIRLNDYVYRNRGEDKEYREIYRRFLSTVTLPEDYINKMLDSEYFRHFWSEKEIASLAEAWRRRGDHHDVSVSKENV